MGQPLSLRRKNWQTSRGPELPPRLLSSCHVHRIQCPTGASVAWLGSGPYWSLCGGLSYLTNSSCKSRSGRWEGAWGSSCGEQVWVQGSSEGTTVYFWVWGKSIVEMNLPRKILKGSVGWQRKVCVENQFLFIRSYNITENFIFSTWWSGGVMIEPLNFQFHGVASNKNPRKAHHNAQPTRGSLRKTYETSRCSSVGPGAECHG